MNILLVDDHQVLISGLQNILVRQEKFSNVWIQLSPVSAVDFVKKEDVDIVLLDINFPGMSGIDYIKEIKKVSPKTKIIIYSMHMEEQYVYKSILQGADGFLVKNGELDEIVEAIQLVFDGNKYFTELLPEHIIQKIQWKKLDNELLVKSQLTKREMEILELVAKGKSNKEIAEILFISDRTANTHRTNIFLKMEVNNSVDLVSKAHRNGLIDINTLKD
jgi:DNA-binding NarL/FixJ family response regulator